MPSWNELLEEIARSQEQSPLDAIRRKYLGQLSKKTDRNVICYYSGFLQKPGNNNISINDGDKNGLMATIHGLDRKKGLDLLLHTPGGNIAATESIVHYLRQMFGTNIRAFIPQIAMSAGTMIACSCKEIYMGKQSSIGPIDPQFGGIPAHGVIEEFERAIESVKLDPKSTPIWQTIVSKYHPTFLQECEHAIQMSTEVVTDWLSTGMFEGDSDAGIKVDRIVASLNNHSDTKTHERHFHIEDAIKLGLKVKALEEDQNLQDLILTVHHAYMHTLANSQAIKVIENHLGNAVIQNVS